MSKAHQRSLEFSHPVEVTNLPSGGRTYKLTASEEECADVAKRLGLLSVSELKCALFLKKESGGFIRVSGDFNADITQACVVTLSPISSQIREEVSMTFMEDPDDTRNRKRGGGEELVSVDEDDPPELVDEGRIDLGELVVEQLVLALNPYPRAEGVDFDAKVWGLEEDDDAVSGPNPFAALKKLNKTKPH